MSDDTLLSFPFSFDEFDEETQLAVGVMSRDLIVQVRDKFNKHLSLVTDRQVAMQMALLDVMSEIMLDCTILDLQGRQLTSMYTTVSKDVEGTQLAVEMVARLTDEDPVVKMMLKTGAPEPFSIVAKLEATEAAARKRLKTQENSRGKSSEIPTVDSDKL